MTSADLAHVARVIRWWLRDDAVPFADRRPVYDLIREAAKSLRLECHTTACNDLALAGIRAGSIAVRHRTRVIAEEARRNV